MWMLDFLPNYAFHLLTLIGFIGILASLFPIPYKSIIQIISVAIISFSLYTEGAISNEEAWQLKVKELEVKLATAEVQSVKENVKIKEKVIVKQQLIREKGDDIIKYIDREIVKYDNICPIPKEFIDAHNAAATIGKELK
jgi:hypothetical protein